MTCTVTGTSPVVAPVTNSNGVFAGLAPGVYDVTTTNAASCTSLPASVIINAVPAALSAPTATVTQPTCAVASGTIKVTMPDSYTDMTCTVRGTSPVVAPVTNSNGVFAGLAPGVYDVTTTNASSCTSLPASMTINAVPAALSAPAATVTQPTCAVASGTITVTMPDSYTDMTCTVRGTNPVVAPVTNSNGVFTGLAPGVYDVTTTNASSCTSLPASMTINAIPAGLSAPKVCLTQPACPVTTGIIKVTSPTGTGYTYSIDGKTYASSATFSGVTAGTYNVTVKNSAGCISASTAAVITAPVTLAAPVVSLTQPTCSVTTGTIKITAPTGSGYTYSINGTTYTSSTTFSKLITGTYNVTAKNCAGCVSAPAVAVINAVATLAAPTVTTTQPSCAAVSGIIKVTAPTGTGYTYSIDGKNYTSCTTFSGLNAGTYYVTVKNCTGCLSTATVVVINTLATPSAPTVSIIQPTCALITGTITITAPMDDYTYSIDGTTYTSSATFSGLCARTYNVMVKNSAGCVSDPTVAILNSAAVPSAPKVCLTQPTCSFSTGTIKVTSPTGTGYTYSIDGKTYTSSTTFSGLTAGNYYVSVKNNVGCVSTSSMTVINAPVVLAAPTLCITQPTCNFTTGTIKVTSPTGSGYTYSIDGTTYTSSTTFSRLSAGTYNVTVKYCDGCLSAVTVAVINAVKVTKSAELEPIVSDETVNCTMIIPNGFSPDGNGINDYFKVTCIENYPDAKLRIYSRNGGLVYEKQHYGNLDYWGDEDAAWWNGCTTNNMNSGGNKLASGSYIYILDLNKGSKDGIKTGTIFISY